MPESGKRPAATAERTKDSELLRGGELAGFARWDMPSFDGKSVV